MSGKLIDAATNTFPAEFIKATEYADIDKDGIPWALAAADNALHCDFAYLSNLSDFRRFFLPHLLTHRGWGSRVLK